VTNKEKQLLVEIYDLVSKMNLLQKQRYLGIGEGLVLQAEISEQAQKIKPTAAGK